MVVENRGGFHSSPNSLGLVLSVSRPTIFGGVAQGLSFGV
jgi:hypothetical protein